MRVKIVRTPGELRDVIGHRVMVRKDWEGVVVRQLNTEEISKVGFHPKVHEVVYAVQFDKWEQEIAVPSVNLVIIEESSEASS